MDAGGGGFTTLFVMGAYPFTLLTGSQFSLLHETNYKINGKKTKKKTIEQSSSP